MPVGVGEELPAGVPPLMPRRGARGATGMEAVVAVCAVALEPAEAEVAEVEEAEVVEQEPVFEVWRWRFSGRATGTMGIWGSCMGCEPPEPPLQPGVAVAVEVAAPAARPARCVGRGWLVAKATWRSPMAPASGRTTCFSGRPLVRRRISQSSVCVSGLGVPWCVPPQEGQRKMGLARSTTSSPVGAWNIS